MNWIKRLLGLEHKVDSKPYKKAFKAFDVMDSYRVADSVTNFEVTKSRKGTVVYITSTKCGYVIGHKGKRINKLKEFMRFQMDDNTITIHLKESDLFSNLY